MMPGDLVITKHVTADFANGKVHGTFGYKAPKGGRLVLLYLGDDAPETGQLDPVRRLYELGWSNPNYPDPRTPNAMQDAALASAEGPNPRAPQPREELRP